LHLSFPPPSSGRWPRLTRTEGVKSRIALQLLTPSVADYRDTSPRRASEGALTGEGCFQMRSLYV